MKLSMMLSRRSIVWISMCGVCEAKKIVWKDSFSISQKKYDYQSNASSVSHHRAQRMCAVFAYLATDAFAAGDDDGTVLCDFWDAHRSADQRVWQFQLYSVYRAGARDDGGDYQFLFQCCWIIFWCEVSEADRRTHGIAYLSVTGGGWLCDGRGIARI